MKSKEIIKRYTLYIISLFILGLDVAFAKTARLGVSPILSVPDTAITLEFSSPGYFATVFRRITNMAPTRSINRKGLSS